jgi:sn-glycerol 3-phosphate transport system substrate-binding protein
MYPAAPVTGASFVIPKSNTPERQAAAWALIKYLSSPEIAGGWARGSGYLAPSPAAYEQPAMKEYLAQHPDAKPSVEQLAYARGWFSSFRSTTVRMALEDGVQAVISGKATPQAAMQKAQSEAESLMRPYVERTALKLPD